MTTESMQPQPELGPAVESAPAQPQGHRRRRRRRKNKSSQQAAVQPQPQPQQAQQLASQPPPAPQPPLKSAPVQQRQSRRKKKFFQKAQAPAQQPGNSVAPAGQKRRGKLKGPREFVGPMDHRYRAANGNASDGPPSTIPVSGNNHSGYYADSYQPQQPPTVREDAPIRIFCFIEDLFFIAKIQETGRKLGVKVEFVKGGDKEAVARMNDLKETGNKPMLMVFDLNNLNAKPMTLIPKLKNRYKKAISIIGFLNHLQGDLKMKALDAGCDTVMPRSAFSQSLPVLLRRYGVEEEEEDHARQPA